MILEDLKLWLMAEHLHASGEPYGQPGFPAKPTPYSRTLDKIEMLEYHYE